MKMRYFFIFLSFWSIGHLLSAKEVKYPVADIAKELKENARSVIRTDEKTFEIKSTSYATLNVTRAITILNKNGLQDAIFHEEYGKYSKLSGIKGKIYNANGELVKKISPDEVIDLSAISGFTLYEDQRVKLIDPKILSLPFTVEYSFDESFNGLYAYPTWFPQPDYNISVEKSIFNAIVPKGFSFRYKEYNLTSRAQVTSEGEKVIYQWSANNFRALEPEPYSVPLEGFYSFVRMAPSDFEFANRKGNLSSWENIGVWACSLTEGKDKLPDEVVANVKKLVLGLSTDIEKVKRIYEFMQDRTRFVSIQIGIGGLEPFDASTVHRLAYGDCKALSNYLKALLNAVGIRSIDCWVKAGENSQYIDREFPSDQFNHVFLCVPLGKDSIWLECTDQRNPFGFLGTFTDDRDILLLEKNKSRIVHTPAYGIENNLQKRIANIKLNEDGTGNADVHSIYKGICYSEMSHLYYSDDKDRRRMISEDIKFPSFAISDYKYKEQRDVIPVLEEDLNIAFENCFAMMGARRFLSVNFANKLKDVPGNVRSRKSDVLIRRPFMDIDTIIYHLPITLKPESLPNPVTIKTQFGEYRAKVEFKDNKLYYSRVFQLNKGKYPASAYAGFVDFYDKIAFADNMKCALIIK